MTQREQSIKRLDRRREKRANATKATESAFDELFEREWEEFVVKFDEQTGKFITQTVCCSMEPVN